MNTNAPLHYTIISVLLIITILHFYQSYSVKEITINNNGEILTIETAAADVAELLHVHGIALTPGVMVEPASCEPLESGMAVEVNRAAAVKLVKPQEQITHYTLQGTVGELLAELSLSPENCLLISPTLNAPVYSGMEISLVPYEIETRKVYENIPYQVKSKEDDSLDQGRRIILQEGQEGVRELAYQVYFLGETELYRELSTETIIVEPAEAVVALGTRPPLRIASREKTETVYTKEGIASWYGPGFHGRRTANGEIYDQNKLTAAHLSLPFNTLVKVTFVHTGKEVVVRINDRGPYIRGRIIDLSHAAAEEIGLCPHGVGKVIIEIVGNGR